ncbi:GNAT family N-acetyltransferase [Streptomyces sp. SL13]|uniref:GNAT family N-acetyltransferase n=1 Tax=Streptantibioticus silvisoli TaxID=2705255 RepID=A0AA90HDR1_9ACTN|nr:GNAT family N-acetyltransferase [Streptantibioticus silvisoli]MDI5973865.1 GNAT family N-acetyltransferase [Streptantibioticus silvisoli]
MSEERYEVRPLREHEFAAWVRTVGGSYGVDRDEADVARERAATELDRALGAFDGDEPVGGTTAHSRLMAVPGAVAPVAGVTSVGVAPTHRRRGVLTALMRRQLTDVYESGAEPVAALRPSEAAIYGRFGYGLASRGAIIRLDTRTARLRPGAGTGDGRVRLLAEREARPLLERVYTAAMPELPGWPDRAARFWDARLGDDPGSRAGASALRYAVHRDGAGTPTGYALYRYAQEGEDAVVRVVELATTTREAYAALWEFLIGVDLYPVVSYEGALDEALPHLLTDPRAAHTVAEDRLWVRLVDVERALAARRYAVPLDVVLEVADPFCPWNAGRFRLSADGTGASCHRTSAAADLRLSAAELGAAYLGGTSPATLGRAGLAEELRPGTLRRCALAFRGEREPYYPGGWAYPAY